MPNYIVTVTSQDRVGIIHGLTDALTQRGGNVLELSQTVMRGFFTIILEVHFPDEQNPEDLRHYVTEQNRGFELSVTVLAAGDEHRQPRPVVRDGERFILTVLGQDQPGNIRGISRVLADHGVNIVDLSAQVDETMFALVMEAFLPPDLSPEQLRQLIEDFGQDKGLSAYVQHENIFLATAEPRPVRIRPLTSQEGLTVDRL